MVLMSLADFRGDDRMTRRQAKRIYRRWLLFPSESSLPWRKPTLDRALDYWIHKRQLPHKVATGAW
jgi:hypothetical protein